MELLVRSTGSSNRHRRSLPAALAKDPFVGLTLGVFVAFGALYVLPILSAGQRIFLTHRLAFPIFLVLVVAAIRYEIDALFSSEERAFWHDLLIGYGAWFLGSLTDLLVSREVELFHRLSLDDAIYGIYYIAVLQAIERQPHLRDRWRPVALERRLLQPAIYAFVFALFTYFVVVPTQFPVRSASDIPISTFLYAALDGYIVARILFIFRTVSHRRWRLIYSLLGLASLGNLVIDLSDGFAPVEGDSPFNALWMLPFVFVILAARARGQMVLFASAPADSRPVGLNPPFEKTIAFAVLLPVIHFAAYLSGQLDPATRAYRENLVLVWLVLLGALALLQHRLFEISTRELRLDRAQTERALVTGERDMHFQVERQAAIEKVRACDEQFFKVFGHESVIVQRLGDGCLVEALSPTGEILGFRRAEVLGRSLREIGCLARGEWSRLIRELRSRGRLDGIEVELREKSGAQVRGFLSTALYEAAGRSLALTILRQANGRRGGAGGADREAPAVAVPAATLQEVAGELEEIGAR